MPNYLLIAVWTAQIIVAIIFAQTLYFKLTGSEESKYIFSKIGIEPWGRYLIAFAELAVVILLLVPATAAYGAVGALLVVIPAIIFHLTILGISVMNDKGLLFGLAVTIAVLSTFVAWARFFKL